MIKYLLDLFSKPVDRIKLQFPVSQGSNSADLASRGQHYAGSWRMVQSSD